MYGRSDSSDSNQNRLSRPCLPVTVRSPKKKHTAMSNQSHKRQKTRGATNRLQWLQAMDPDAFKVLMNGYISWHAVYRVVMRDIAHPAWFVNMSGGGEWTFIVEFSRYYVHYIRPRSLYNEPSCRCIELLFRKTQASLCGLRLTMGGSDLGVTYRANHSKALLTHNAAKHGIRIRPNWTKKRIWQEIMRAGPNADAPRFKTYLTHRVVDGRVVAEQHAA
jgi:hypothetical protein